jgi:hypothetical protein
MPEKSRAIPVARTDTDRHGQTRTDTDRHGQTRTYTE